MSVSLPKIAILVTTFERDELLFKSIHSIVDVFDKNYTILIADQGTPSEAKAKWVLETKSKLDDQFHYRTLPYNIGLSAGRNFLVNLAKEKKYEYCLLSADSICFTSAILKVVGLLPELETYDFIGLSIINRNAKSHWIGKINLIKNTCFELEPIECLDNKIHNVEIVKNFFITKTETVLHHKWDEDLKLGEHESFFWEAKLKGLNVGYIKLDAGLYIGKESKSNNSEYARMRRINFDQGLKKLKEKYNLKNWVSYK